MSGRQDRTRTPRRQSGATLGSPTCSATAASNHAPDRDPSGDGGEPQLGTLLVSAGQSPAVGDRREALRRRTPASFALLVVARPVIERGPGRPGQHYVLPPPPRYERGTYRCDVPFFPTPFRQVTGGGGGEPTGEARQSGRSSKTCRGAAGSRPTACPPSGCSPRGIRIHPGACGMMRGRARRAICSGLAAAGPP